jgi:hypothetical protein
LLHTEPYKEIEPMMVTTFEKGIAKGRQEGRLEKQRELARLLLERKFGALPETMRNRLLAWSEEQLDKLILAIQDAPSLQALGLADDDKPS